MAILCAEPCDKPDTEMYRKLFLAALAISSASSFLLISSANAHHGGAVEWQENVVGPVTGIATEFAFRFPHVVIYVDVQTRDGIQNWAMTTRWTPTILRQHGWSRRSVTPGDTLVLTYAPHVSSSSVAQMRTIEINGQELPLQF